MGLINSILTWVMQKRIHQMELFIKYPIEVQEEIFKKLIQTARYTEFGKQFDFSSIYTYDQFRDRVPIHTYEQTYPYIERLMKGEQNILWPSEIKWFSKSSGTTNARSKFIPVSQEALEDCHFKGGKDLLSIYVNNFPETKLFDGKGLAVGGSHQINEFDPSATSYYGDVSAVIMQNLPSWAQFIRTPSLETALMGNWEEKIEKLARETVKDNVTNIAGVPTWTVLLIQKVVELEKKNNILEVWPNLEVFFHGAVSFTPYRSLFESLIPSDKMQYWETYNASEGFFGIQDQRNSEELLLMLDYGIFYEFIPAHELDKEHPRALRLGEVELDKNYAMVISTNSGLWRYNLGDTVKFTSLSPYRIKITGRTKHFINAFGEEVIVENAEEAITRACKVTGAVIDNFTAAPVYLAEGRQGCHEWIIEFKVAPSTLPDFTHELDQALRSINSDYDAKRHRNLALIAPKVHSVREGTFYNWMKRRGKLGGQNKVPRLANSREYVDDILKMMRES
ncbi:GH3 auxin-responsive promoter family protein [Chryseolinea lacunae]|uniref:GH3 auxin-responsive promoter family protein n=1 Tax=Chryseolinea lacunae TaxID=2801331 RepID=A0ABS1KQW4_9BACT|nr:GH3 auxin-responsive promoter family protein [Chryseolinea lacunae]MBL0741821.1 GH3 auxin-responsive promoter family protein [Chryseolinea lacunae]